VPRYGRREAVLQAESSDQRRCPVEEGSVIEDQALGTDRLFLHLHVAEVQALHE